MSKIKTNSSIIKLFLPVLIVIFSFGNAYAADLYVDINSTNIEETGSEASPYHSITAALAKAGINSENSRQILVKPGNYNEEVILPENTILSGENKNTVVIDRDTLEGATVTMGKNSTIENITVRGGNYGLIVPEYKNATLRNCVIEKTKRIGIWIKRSNKLQTNRVEVWDSEIKNNNKKGLYGESRFIYVIGNRIEGNGEEGIDLRSKVNGAVTKNTISGNGEGGVEIEIRKVALEISGNTLTLNKSNGITLNNRTNVGGKIIIRSNIIKDNLHYGIRCAGTKKWPRSLWRKSTKNSNNAMSGNKRKNISTSCNSK